MQRVPAVAVNDARGRTVPCYEGYVFDLDGTLYLGEAVIEGAPRVIASLRADGARVCFLTNKAIVTREAYAEKLARLGIPCRPEEVVTSSQVLSEHLASTAPGARLYVIGEEPLLRVLRASGLRASRTDWQGAQYVVLSWDRQFHYDQIAGALQAIRAGARTIATNPDRTCPVSGGEVPDAGAIIGAVEGATGRPLDLNVGKPSRLALDAALRVLGRRASQCLMVGDRIETDIRMATDAGMDSALVLTGVARPSDLADGPDRPTYVLPSVAFLVPSPAPVARAAREAYG